MWLTTKARVGFTSLLVSAFLLSFGTVGLAEEQKSASVQLGDVTGDSVINAADALAVLQYAVGKSSVMKTIQDAGLMADVTGDGTINAQDALEQLQYAVGKREIFTGQNKEFESPYLYVNHDENWDKIDSALSERLAISQFQYPVIGEKFEHIYRKAYTLLGFGSVPGMVQYSVDHLNDGSLYNMNVDLCLAGFNLQLYLHPHLWKIVHDQEPGKTERYSNEALVKQFMDFVHSVPEKVESICTNESMTLEEQRYFLGEYGMLALPFLADRIMQGETQWEDCFAYQLLGLPQEERIRVLFNTYDFQAVNWYGDPDWWLPGHQSEKPVMPQMWEKEVYAMRCAAALPMNVSYWIEEHTIELNIIRHWCMDKKS